MLSSFRKLSLEANLIFSRFFNERSCKAERRKKHFSKKQLGFLVYPEDQSASFFFTSSWKEAYDSLHIYRRNSGEERGDETILLPLKVELAELEYANYTTQRVHQADSQILLSQVKSCGDRMRNLQSQNYS